MTFFETRTAYVVLFAVGFVLYGHTLFFREYTHQDDYHLIVVNYPLISDPAHITKAFVEEAFHERKQGGNIYRPFLTLSLMLDAQLSGTNPLGYRLHNLLLHGFATVLLFVTLTRLNLRREVAFFSALLFAVHPATTQTVVWIPGRNDLLLALFLFLSLLSLLRFKKLPQLRWVFLHGFFFACALFTKETALVFPALFLPLLLQKRNPSVSLLHYALLLLLWVAAITDWSILRAAAMVVPADNSLRALVILAEKTWMLIPYLGTILWPVNIFVISFPQDLSLGPGLVCIALLVAAIATARERNWSLFVFGAFWLILTLTPTLYQHPGVDVPQRIMQHRIYLPFVGLLMMFGALSFGHLLRQYKHVPQVGAVFMLVILVPLAVERSSAYENALTFSEAIARTSPGNFYVHHAVTMMQISPHLQTMLLHSDYPTRPTTHPRQLAQYRDTIERAVAEFPDNPQYRNDLAAVHFAFGLLVSAEQQLLRTLAQHPNDTTTLYNLGVLYYNSHREQLAEQHWRRSLELDPSIADAHRNLCYLYYRWKNYAAALMHAEQAQMLGTAIPYELLDELRALDKQSLEQ